MNDHDEHTEHAPEPVDSNRHEEHPRADIPEHMKPENLEKLRNYGKDMIPPGVA